MAERKWVEKTVDTGGEMWDKEKPLEGKLVKVDHNVGPNSSNIYTVGHDGTELKFWGSTVLDDKLMGVPTGTYVKIEYNGKQTSKKGTQYHDYRVFIDEDSVPQESPEDGIVPMPPEGEAISLDEMPEDFLQ